MSKSKAISSKKVSIPRLVISYVLVATILGIAIATCSLAIYEYIY